MIIRRTLICLSCLFAVASCTAQQLLEAPNKEVKEAERHSNQVEEPKLSHHVKTTSSNESYYINIEIEGLQNFQKHSEIKEDDDTSSNNKKQNSAFDEKNLTFFLYNHTPQNYLNTPSEDSSFKISDLVSAMLSTLALLLTYFAHRLNISNIRTLENNRKIDKSESDYTFWLKDVVYPKYISEIINYERELHAQIERLKLDFSDEKTLEEIKNTKYKLTAISLEGAKIPFFSDLFNELNSKFNNIHDKIILLADDNESLSFIDGQPMVSANNKKNNTDKTDIVNECLRDISNTTSWMFSYINLSQKKIRNEAQE